MLKDVVFKGCLTIIILGGLDKLRLVLVLEDFDLSNLLQLLPWLQHPHHLLDAYVAWL